MAIKTFKPTTPSRRHMTVSAFEGIDMPLVEACTRWRYSPEAFTRQDETLIRSQWPQWQSIRQALAPGEFPGMDLL